MKDPRFVKSVVFVNSAVPLLMLGWDAFNHQLGVNPVESAIHISGMLALIFLMLSLTVTPLRLFTGWNWLSHFRRMLGLYAFFYGCVHLMIYFIFQRSMSIGGVIEEALKRKFIFFGMTALLLMVPLAITSTNGMIKRMGSARWKRLHQLVYISAVAAVIHFYNSSKVVNSLEIAFVVIVTVLLGYRLFGKRLTIAKRRTPVRPRVAAVQ